MNYEELDIRKLVFDKQNPRLPTSVRGSSEDDILRYLATKTGIERLMTSIGENDFFAGEAIVVTASNSKFIVIEGNRRLAALRLLHNPTIINRPGIVRAAENAKSKPDKVPAYIVSSREETLQYLGFRHISGVQRWDPLAKARYLESLFRRTEGQPQKQYLSVAREIGSSSNAVRRNLDALAAFKIIEEMDYFDIGEMAETTFQFGTFYTAISNTDIANFIGTRHDGNPSHPITDGSVVNEKHLEELVRWMFERDSRGNTKLGESRNIRKLGTVVASSESLQALREGYTLDAAYRLTSHAKGEFIRHMNEAIEELKLANANLHSVDLKDRNAQRAVREALKIIQVASDRLGIEPYD